MCKPKYIRTNNNNINMSPSKRSSGSGKPITASPSAIPNFSKPTTSNPLPKRYPLSQRKHTGGPRALPLPLPLTLTGQSARTQIHTLLSKHTKQAKAKQLQAHWGGNCKPLPIPFETLIRSNGSDHKLLQHHFCTVACNHQCRRRQTRRGKHMSPCCCTGCRHSPNAPPDLDFHGVWWTSNTTDKSSKLTNFDANPLSYCVCLYQSTQSTSAINLLRPN